MNAHTGHLCSGGFLMTKMQDYIPLYTHPVKTDDGGKVCARCGAIAFDPVITQTAKTLTDEEIDSLADEFGAGMEQFGGCFRHVAFARAILRKASEK